MSITVLDNFLTSAEIAEYRAFVDRHGHTLQAPILHEQGAVATDFWRRFGERLRTEAGVQRITDRVTVSRSDRPLKWHYDVSKEDDTHKVLIYLDDIAGTLFQMEDGRIQEVAAKPGRAVVFDFRLKHAGAPIPPGGGKKYTIGFRGIVPAV
jgi:hypothetical protein